MIRNDIAVACTGCAYCVDDCPKNIAIPEYFAMYNKVKRFQGVGLAWEKQRYAKKAEERGKASDCIECGKCETACPQHLQIKKLLKDVAKEYGVEMRLYTIIYKVVEEMEAAMKGMLDPEFEEKVIGQAEIRATSVADPRKSSKLVLTVLEAGAKMPDEANAYHITGNVSVEAWNENSKYYNMFEHAIWDPVCGHCPIFNMQMAHGSYENYSPLTFADGQLFADLENREGTRINGGWQCFMTDTDALVFAIEAKENVFVKTKENPNGLGGWVSDTVWTILRKNLDGTYTEVLATQNPTVATITTEWTELQAGESYIIEVKSVCSDLRNFENIPYIDVAPVLVGE